ncbi:hypothetical protein Dda_6292 [Drechslerella dactyloides]|uniref:SET domain-containing protein n=1 Tax=Drechslerella dactyloides TaxID=74499 RepID=A0AAD6NH63_DREDA|nr:hypothetical protein Dda_6292 [Drechslerella dactyloides]
MAWGKFASKNMFDPQWYLRREKMIIYQLAMILMVCSESVGTAALSDYVDQQDYLERAFPGSHIHNNDIVGIASFNIFIGVAVATIFGAAFFFDLFWPDRYESPGVKLAWKISAVAVCVGALADALAYTVIVATHKCWVDGVSGEDENALLEKAGQPSWLYRKNPMAVASIVLLWLGLVFTIASTFILFKFYAHNEAYGPKSHAALEAEKTQGEQSLVENPPKPTPPPVPQYPENPNYFSDKYTRAEDVIARSVQIHLPSIDHLTYTALPIVNSFTPLHKSCFHQLLRRPPIKMSTPMVVDKTRTETLRKVTKKVEALFVIAAANQGRKIPTVSRDVIIQQHRNLKQKADENFQEAQLKRCMISDYREPANPVVPVEKLRKLLVKDLVIGKHHKGCYLKVRLTATAFRAELAVQSVVEDEQGACCLIRLYFRDEDNTANDHLPQGYVIIIRDPYIWSSGECEAFFVRVDHPHDLVYLYPWKDAYAKLVPSNWKSTLNFDMLEIPSLLQLASICCRQEEFHSALLKYDCVESKARKLSDTSKAAQIIDDCRLRRAGIHVKLRQHLLGAPDIDAILRKSPQNIVALHLRALRYYYIGRYDLCQEELAKLMTNDPDNFLYKDLRLRAKERHEEVKLGKYNWKGMRQLACGVYIDLDHADYTNPVKLKKTPKGRRIFTARDVKRGDLLMVVKAVAIVTLEASNSCVQLSYRDGRLETEFGVGPYLTSEIIERLKREPAGFYEKTLCLMEDGGYTSCGYKLPDGTKVRDAFHIEEIRRINSLNITNLPIHPGQSLAYLPMGTMPLSRLTAYNSGLWFLPSFLRHSCIPNAHRTVIGDMMIIRAGRDMPKDTKVTISCVTPSTWEYPLVKFICTCPVHEYDAVDGNKPGASEESHYRQKLWDQFTVECERIEKARTKPEKWAKLKLNDLLPSMMSKLVAIERTMPPASQVPHVQLAHRYRYIAAAYYSSGQRRHALCAYYKVLDSLGVEYYVMDNIDKLMVINHGQCSEDLLHAYRDLAALATTPGLKKAWRKASIDIYEILYGERLSYDSVVHTLEFVDGKDQCPCVGIDNFAINDPKETKKRFGIDETMESEWIATTEGIAMAQFMTLAAKKAWVKTVETEIMEDDIRKKALEMLIQHTTEKERKARARKPAEQGTHEEEAGNKENEEKKN